MPTDEVFGSVHEPLLGTRVSLRVRADGEAAALVAEAAAIGEMERLEALLSTYRSGSEWSRWRRGERAATGPEVRAVLVLAAQWHARTGGAFNPLAGVLRERWLRAVDEQQVPPADELAVLAGGIARLPYAIDGDRVERLGDCSRLDLHAIAKGWIVDRAAAAAAACPGVQEVLLNAGGDLVHLGDGEVVAGVEDPRRPFDNVPPMARVRVVNAGLATGSGARRPYRIGGQTFNHTLDPATGQPVDHVRSASVIAPDAATADALATAVAVLPIDEGVRLVDTTAGCGCLLLDADGVLWRNDRWAALEPPSGG